MARPPFGELRYLYMGTRDVEAALRWWTDVVGAPEAWDATAFGTRVAAVRPGAGPLLLLAGHLPPGTMIPLYAVERLDRATRELERRGWKANGEPFGIPDGPCVRFDDPSGNPFGLFQPDRPDAMGGDGGASGRADGAP